MMTKTCNFCGCYSGHEDNCPRAIAERRGERFDDLAHLRALSEPKDDMLKRETPLPKASAVCPVCGLDRPHGHGQEELITLIVSLKAERDAAVAAWECAKRQNSHDMLLSGDEIHQHDAAIDAARREGGK